MRGREYVFMVLSEYSIIFRNQESCNSIDWHFIVFSEHLGFKSFLFAITIELYYIYNEVNCLLNNYE